jgi:hypothetical protein
MTCALWDELWVGTLRPRPRAPPSRPLGQQDPADLAAADLDALGLGGRGEGIQGPVRRRLGLGGGQQSLAALL